ncbi:CheR family methyltransferase [Paraglaciecola sp.]|uniref:CheR family methyltransferase n=1 Tax=Paraglaciecola sp. TaxID=1920173 RepID=UPI0030F39054
MDHGREFSFSQQDFENVRNILYKKSGIRLADSKDSMVYSRLARRLRVLRITSVTDYLKYLDENNTEEQQFINALTTNLTSFYREKHHFPILQDYLVSHPGKRRIWCAASSTGEEPYSIAMTVAETFDSFTTPVEIIASDIDSVVLEKARAGIYSQDSVRDLSAEQLKRFFHRGKMSNNGFVRAVPELRKMVNFRQINLTHTKWDIKPQVDVLFCRNVMIYFDKETQIKILTQMVELMSVDGLYIAGHSETFANATHLVAPIGKTVYRPVAGGKNGL